MNTLIDRLASDESFVQLIQMIVFIVALGLLFKLTNWLFK